MTRAIEVVTWGLSLGCLIGAAAVLFRTAAVGSVVESTGALEMTPRAVTLADPKTISVGSELIASRNPFRLDRRPAMVRFGAAPQPTRPGSTPRPLALVLTGTFGPPWQGVIEGIPGKQGPVLVREGEAFGELRIRSVRRDTVVVQGADTVWKLTVRRPW